MLCYYAECHYTECRYVERRYAKCQCASNCKENLCSINHAKLGKNTLGVVAVVKGPNFLLKGSAITTAWMTSPFFRSGSSSFLGGILRNSIKFFRNLELKMCEIGEWQTKVILTKQMWLFCFLFCRNNCGNGNNFDHNTVGSFSCLRDKLVWRIFSLLR